MNATGHTIYLDHSATTPVDPRVVEAMTPYWSEVFGNTSSIHSVGQEAAAALERARKEVAGLLGCQPAEVILTACGTESDNIALRGAAWAARQSGRGNHIVTTTVEHHAVGHTVDQLRDLFGFEVTRVPVDGHGQVDPDDVAAAIRPDTILVSVMMANNEVGTVQPVARIGRICQERNVLFHTDAVQAAGRLPLEVEDAHIDLLALSAHKFYGPKGVGLLYVRKGVDIQPLMHGGNHEHSMRAGTENISGIVGFGRACELAGKEMESEADRLTSLRDRLVRGVLRIPKSYLNGHPERRLPGNASFRFDGIEGEALILRLDALGIEASTGSACSSRELKPSHVLTSIGLKPEQAHGSLRITLGRHTTKEDVDHVIQKLPGVVQDLRDISPFWEGG